MVTARAPIAIAACARAQQVLLSGFGRCPQAAPRKPFHLRVRMLLTDTVERRQQVRAFGRAKCRWQAACEDGPVRVSRWHCLPRGPELLLGPESLQFFDERRPFDAQ